MRVIKRDGKLQEFDKEKIRKCLELANSEIEEEDRVEGSSLTKLVNAILGKIAELTVVDISNDQIRDISVEEIQDIVENELIRLNKYKLAKHYIKYRYQHQKVRDTEDTLLNYKKVVNGYLKVDDWRVKENSTVSYSLGGLILSNSGAVTANYWLSEVYDDEIANAHRNADIHIHDLSMLSGYCAGWSLKQLIQEGLGGVPGKIASKPASHLHTLCNQMVNFLGIMQNEWAGAQAFSSFDTYLAPFVKVDNLSYKEVKQCIQSFVFGVNTPSRWGCQAPFTNVTIDWTVPSDLAELNAIVGGKEMDFRYKDCQKEMDMVNKAFLEVMIEGDANGRGFQYPIPTYSITRDFDWSETENNKLLFEMTAKYGIPYFSNYINSDMEPSDVRSMCPLTPDTLVTVRSNQNGIRVAPIKDIYRTYENHKTEYQVWTGKQWCNGHPVQTPKTDVYEIKFSNGYSVRMGKDHLQPTKDFGTVHADELKCGMWIPFSKGCYGSDLGSYDMGYAIGAYAGDGSHDKSSVVYSLCAQCKDDDTEKRIVEFWRSIGFSSKTTIDDNVRFVRINGNPYGIIEKYISGDNALNKGFTNDTFNASIEFKNGLIDGYMATDGSRNRSRIYTSSKIMKDHLNVLLSSVGRKCTQTLCDERDGRFGGSKCYTVGVPNRKSYGEYFTEDDNYFYYKIVSIDKCKYDGDYLYCFEIDNDDHLFALSNGLITHNCRLRLDLRELRKKSGGFFGSGESTGSVGVVTINMPRIAYLSKSEDEFYKKLDHMMNISARSLKTKRTVIEKLLEAGLYPYTKRYLGTFNNHFSTIGLVGMNEACLNACWLKKDLTNIESQKFTIDVLNHMREKLSDYQEQYGDLYNLEATPAESTSYRLAKHDVEKYPDIITASMASGVPYYTNSSHLPVGYTDDIFSALDIQDELQTLYTSGTVFHAFLGEKLPSWQSAANLVRKIAENYRLPYFTMSPTYSVCKDHGYLVGEQYTCPYCGKPTEVYSRITGYYRPVQNWNDGKAQEFKDRKTYNLFNSYIDHASKIPTCDSCSIEEPVKESGEDIILVATPTCPNCKIACSLLDKKSISYNKLYANENKDIVEKYNIKQAPTLVVNGTKYVGVSEIKRYLESV